MVMLFAWLFTVGAGIANACLLHEHHAPAGQVRGLVAPDAQGAVTGVDVPMAAQSVSAVAPQQDDHDQLLEAVNCRAVCATVQTALPKQKPLFLADLGADPVWVAVSGPLRVLPGPVSASPGAALAPRPEPPVFIRFLRLTL